MAGKLCTDAADYFKHMQQMLAAIDNAAIDAYAEMVFEAWRDDRTVFVFGNGGSAYTASHHVTDYVRSRSPVAPRLESRSAPEHEPSGSRHSRRSH